MLSEKRTTDNETLSRKESNDYSFLHSEESSHNYISKAKKAAQYIHVMLHAKDCKGTCGKDICKTTYELLDHSLHCESKGCNIAGCSQTRILFGHARECRAGRSRICDKEALPCLICSFLSVYENNRKESSSKSSKRKDDFAFAVPALPKRFRREVDENITKDE
eukprot:gene6325-12799_t